MTSGNLRTSSKRFTSAREKQKTRLTWKFQGFFANQSLQWSTKLQQTLDSKMIASSSLWSTRPMTTKWQTCSTSWQSITSGCHTRPQSLLSSSTQPLASRVSAHPRNALVLAFFQMARLCSSRGAQETISLWKDALSQSSWLWCNKSGIRDPRPTILTRPALRPSLILLKTEQINLHQQVLFFASY